MTYIVRAGVYHETVMERKVFKVTKKLTPVRTMEREREECECVSE